jgi:hypothetical protein
VPLCPERCHRGEASRSGKGGATVPRPGKNILPPFVRRICLAVQVADGAPSQTKLRSSFQSRCMMRASLAREVE